MPAEYLACVDSEMERGKSREEAQRICAIAFYKRHGETPQQAAGETDMAMLRDMVQADLAEAEARGDRGRAADLRALLEAERQTLGRQPGGRGEGPGGKCVCPECGHTATHDTGEACNKKKCPKCGATMTREGEEKEAPVALEATKTENGEQYPASAYAYAPDKDKPSTWKLRLWESPEKKATVAQLGRAAAALSAGGFRGNRVKLPSDAVAGVKRRIRSEYRKLGVKADDMPASVREQLVAAGILTEYRGDRGEAVLGMAVERGVAASEAYWYGYDGSYEDVIGQVDRAVQAQKGLFGVAAASDGIEDWLSVEATFADSVIVRRQSDDQRFRATWSAEKNDAGEVTGVVFSDVRPVRVTLQVSETERAPELRETYVAPVRVIQEQDRENGRGGSDHLMTVECVLGEAETPTRNGRVYPRSLFQSLVSESAEGTDRSKRWLGESDHPSDGYPRLSETISTPWRGLRMEADTLLGTCDIIDTRRGTDVQKLIRNGVPVQTSSRTFASTKTEVKGGEQREVVDEKSALDNWGGWDFVLGAATAGEVRSYSESGAGGPPAAAAGDDDGESLGESVDEVLAAMTPEELQKTIAETVEKAVKPLMETNDDPGDGGDADLSEEEKKKRAEAEAKGGGAGAGDERKTVEQVMAAVEKLGEGIQGINERFTKQDDEARKLSERKVVEAARKAVLESEAIKAWPEPARKLLAMELEKAGSAEEITQAAERAQKMCVETGLLIISGEAGVGKAGVHASSSSEKSGEDKARDWRNGRLEIQHYPRTPAELVDLACEGIEDNGLGPAETGGPDSPVLEFLRQEQGRPRNYHPGNPRSVFRQVLLNTIREHPEYVHPHLRDTAEQSLYQQVMEWTGTANVVNSTPFVLPLIRQTWPRIIAMELCSTQPMSKPSGRIHYLEFLYDPSNADPSNTSEYVSDYGNDVSEQSYIPEMKLQISGYDITMDTKKLRSEWSVEAQQDLRAEHGIDIAGAMLGAMSDEVAREINSLLLNVMLNNADPHHGQVTAGNTNFGTGYPGAAAWPQGSLREWHQELFTSILQANNNVLTTHHRSTNWMVCDTNFSLFLMKQSNWRAWSADDEMRDLNVGIERLGTLEGSPGWRVYVSEYMTANMALLGRKGSDWFDAGTVYSPYVPIYTSPVNVNSTLCVSQAIMSRFGYRKVLGRTYATVTLQRGVAGVPLT